MERALTHIIKAGLESIESTASHISKEESKQLSPRQHAVLDGIRRGKAIKEIGADLGVSEVTVRTHINRIRERLGCADLLSLRIPGM